LWGTGTAIGELPPYFVSRAASIAGQRSEELADLISSESQSNSSDEELLVQNHQEASLCSSKS
jgi:hypothetical protein